jgi:hypothetical protein
MYFKKRTFQILFTMFNLVVTRIQDKVTVIQLAYKFLENVEELRYFGMKVTNPNHNYT